MRMTAQYLGTFADVPFPCFLLAHNSSLCSRTTLIVYAYCLSEGKRYKNKVTLRIFQVPDKYFCWGWATVHINCLNPLKPACQWYQHGGPILHNSNKEILLNPVEVIFSPSYPSRIRAPHWEPWRSLEVQYLGPLRYLVDL